MESREADRPAPPERGAVAADEADRARADIMDRAAGDATPGHPLEHRRPACRPGQFARADLDILAPPHDDQIAARALQPKP